MLVMTTSNLVNAIGEQQLVPARIRSQFEPEMPRRTKTDTAFIDRADIVQYVGLPPQEGIYWILQSCITELIRAQIVSPVVRDDSEIRLLHT